MFFNSREMLVLQFKVSFILQPRKTLTNLLLCHFIILKTMYQAHWTYWRSWKSLKNVINFCSHQLLPSMVSKTIVLNCLTANLLVLMVNLNIVLRCCWNLLLKFIKTGELFLLDILTQEVVILLEKLEIGLPIIQETYFLLFNKSFLEKGQNLMFMALIGKLLTALESEIISILLT